MEGSARPESTPAGIQGQRHPSGRQANQKTTASGTQARRRSAAAPGPPPVRPAQTSVRASSPPPLPAPTQTPPQTPPESAASQAAVADIGHRKRRARSESGQPPPA